MGQAVTFWICAVLAVAAALGVVFSRRAVYSALMLALVMLSLAVLYAAQEAPFLAFVQVVVYTGAVVMLFLFVLMLVGVDSSDSLVETIRGQRLWAGIATLGFAVLFVGALGGAVTQTASGLGGSGAAGNVRAVAALLFTDYVLAFEVTGALLITAALGAMVLTHPERTKARATQKQLSIERFRGDHPTPLPGPGVYARHDAVDRPALLPDGKPSELSVSPVIARQREQRGEQEFAPVPELGQPEREDKR
jgi:NADH-quinone oxidoreductase subunit J